VHAQYNLVRFRGVHNRRVKLAGCWHSGYRWTVSCKTVMCCTFILVSCRGVDIGIHPSSDEVGVTIRRYLRYELFEGYAPTESPITAWKGNQLADMARYAAVLNDIVRLRQQTLRFLLVVLVLLSCVNEYADILLSTTTSSQDGWILSLSSVRTHLYKPVDIMLAAVTSKNQACQPTHPFPHP
jgi:hypothetical protein